MTINDAGIKLIQSFESCKLESYQDIKGIWTIGWGHTGPEVKLGQTITQEEADDLFQKDLDHFNQSVSFLITTNINENQFSALVSFEYNLGDGSLEKSHLLIYVNNSQFDLASEEFPKWDHSDGIVVDGLLRRRLAEQTLFNS
jgi:lysozyme